jgi:O-acetyl-ADP-ribose deacetylase
MPLGERLVIVQADITTLDVDAIVNAANVALMPGGGVCGAIHLAAGPELADACRDAAPCPTGDARLTPGFGLKARHVVHAVGPVWMGGGNNEDRMLGACYRASMSLADRHSLATIAFPAISTGIYGFPLERATAIALRELAGALEWALRVKQVTCACFNTATFDIYRSTREELRL